MPKADAPEDCGRMVAEAVSSGDIEAVLSLYEPDAVFVVPRAFGEGSVTGTDALREAFNGLLAMSPQLAVQVERTIASGDTALLIGHWTLNGRDADGHDIETGARFADIVRRQSDGSRRYVIDNPNGTD